MMLKLGDSLRFQTVVRAVVVAALQCDASLAAVSDKGLWHVGSET